MKKKLLVALSVCGLAFTSISRADGILAEPILKQWRPVVGLGGGVSSTTNLGESKIFPLLNPITDEYYIYSPESRARTQGLFEVFLGAEHPIFSVWRLQGGLAYAQAGTFNAKGSFMQGADVLSADKYNYQFNAVTRQLLAQAKLMYPYQDKFYPYFLLGQRF